MRECLTGSRTGAAHAVGEGPHRRLEEPLRGEAEQLRGELVLDLRAVGAGDELAKNAEKSMTGIIGEIGELSETIEEFASISSEQADRVDDLNKSVARMDSVTQRNAAAIHRLSGSAEGMLCSAGTLAGEVARFKQAVSGRFAAGSGFRPLASCGEEADDQEIE